MERSINGIYYFIDSKVEIAYTIDKNSFDDRTRFENGNYYNSEEARMALSSVKEAHRVMKNVRLVENN